MTPWVMYLKYAWMMPFTKKKRKKEWSLKWLGNDLKIISPSFKANFDQVENIKYEAGELGKIKAFSQKKKKAW